MLLDDKLIRLSIKMRFYKLNLLAIVTELEKKLPMKIVDV